MKPKLRSVGAQAIEHQGQSMILLRDPLGLSQQAIAVPRPLAPLLGLMDGTRDEVGLEAGLLLRTGVRLAPGLLARLLADLDEAYLLDNERAAEAYSRAFRAYREAPFRPMALDGSSYPADPVEASALLQAWVEELLPTPPAGRDGAGRGLISPHIDYPRGGPVYAEVWRAATQAAREADLVIILGTDHNGGEGTLTLTRQSYATPWGVLPTDREAVDALAEALGPQAAFAEEWNHRGEHSIELAAVWLHFVRGGMPVPLVPILCGSFASFVEGAGDPATHPPYVAALDVLRGIAGARRTLTVAAADLAHVGPAFGDPWGVDAIERAQLRQADESLLATVRRGDAAAFFGLLKAEGDRRHVCGLPPIYLALRLLDGACGEAAGYAICPADAQGTSFVSVAGMILF